MEEKATGRSINTTTKGPKEGIREGVTKAIIAQTRSRVQGKLFYYLIVHSLG